MDVSILFGDKSEATVKAIKSSVDSLDIRPFRTISSFINFIRQSNSDCSRVLINTNSLKTEDDLNILHDFLRSDLPSTSVIFLVSARDTSNIQAVFANIYNLSIYTDVTTKQTNLPFLVECLTESVTDLRTKYSAIKETEEDDDFIMAESYDEGLEEEQPEGDEVIIAYDYEEPILSSEEPQPVSPKDKNRLEMIQQTSLENQSYANILLEHGERMLQEGYFTNKHYPLNLSDVDPTVLLFKQRQQSGEKRLIEVFKPKLDSLKKSLNPIDLLRLDYADTGVLSLSPFYNSIYSSSPITDVNKDENQGKKKNKKPKKEKKGLLNKLFGR